MIYSFDEVAGYISIHALREEGDPPGLLFDAHPVGFLSTPSARRATQLPDLRRRRLRDFYPRPPRGGRPRTRQQKWCCTKFLSTPSARRATTTAHSSLMSVILFLSTPSARRATSDAPARRLGKIISIHALREEGDYRYIDRTKMLDISIHALREEGDINEHIRKLKCEISIHALREEGDSFCLKFLKIS